MKEFTQYIGNFEEDLVSNISKNETFKTFRYFKKLLKHPNRKNIFMKKYFSKSTTHLEAQFASECPETL